MPNKFFDVKETVDFASVFAWLMSDAIFTKTASTAKHPKEGQPIELTNLNLAAGSWLIAAQGSFSVNGANGTQIEYRLSLRYSSGATATIGQIAYARIGGGAFGTSTVIDAVVFDKITTVQLIYEEEKFNPSPSDFPPSTEVRGQILLAVKTPTPFVNED